MRPDPYGYCKTFVAVYRESGIQKTYQTFQTYFSAGTRLLHLVASGKLSSWISLLMADKIPGTIYIIFIIASLELQWQVLNHNPTEVEGVCKALRAPPAGK